MMRRLDLVFLTIGYKLHGAVRAAPYSNEIDLMATQVVTRMVYPIKREMIEGVLNEDG